MIKDLGVGSNQIAAVYVKIKEFEKVKVARYSKLSPSISSFYRQAADAARAKGLRGKEIVTAVARVMLQNFTPGMPLPGTLNTL